MKQLFNITMSTGSYGDYNLEILFITDDFEKGSSYVNKKNSTFESLTKKILNFSQNEMVQWNQDNPRPSKSGFNLKPVPQWKREQTVTQEMRDELQNLILENQLIIQKSNEPITQWEQKHRDFVGHWLEVNLTEEELLMNKNCNENHWDIQPVKWL